ncbi:DUF1800 domain-containing protein [Zobellella endophytica]|nr:DUF1800 domain-containing protein [Zobellella endophytica]
MTTLTLPASSEAIRLYRLAQNKVTRQQGDARFKANQQLLRARLALVQSFSAQSLARLLAAPAQHAIDKEHLLWFWCNHFNVFWRKGLVGAALPDYVESAIRPHILGNFKDLLLAALSHPAMLVYLDNQRNVTGKINENLARELLELHTLGVNGGYSQQDVQQVAEVLTGVGLRPMKAFRLPPRLQQLAVIQGEFMFDPRRHSFTTKTVLGQRISPLGFDEIGQLIDILVAHPATARHIAGKLGTFLLGDAPPQGAITNAAGVFASTHGDLAQTISALLPFARQVTQPSFKDPLRFVLSATRLLANGNEIGNVKPVARWLRLLGQPLFGHQTPDGYNLVGSAWQSAGQLTQRIELAREMVQVVPRLVNRPANPRQLLARLGLENTGPQRPTTGLPAGRINLSENTLSTLMSAQPPPERLALLLASPEFMFWLPGAHHA